MPFHRVVILPFDIHEVEKGELRSKVLQCKLVSDSSGLSERFLVQVWVRQAGEERPSCLSLLLKAPTNEVLDMYASAAEDSVCCIAADNRSIVYVVQTQGQCSFEESIRKAMNESAEKAKAGKQKAVLAPIPETDLAAVEAAHESSGEV